MENILNENVGGCIIKDESCSLEMYFGGFVKKNEVDFSKENKGAKYYEVACRIAKAAGLKTFKINQVDDEGGALIVEGDNVDTVNFRSFIFFLGYQCEELKLFTHCADFHAADSIFGSGEGLYGQAVIVINGWRDIKLDKLEKDIGDAKLLVDSLKSNHYSSSEKCNSRSQIEIKFLKHHYFRENDKINYLIHHEGKLFNGIMIEISCDKELKKKTEIYNGVPHGDATIYYSNGVVMETVKFCNGLKDGKLIGYSDTKHKSYDALFDNDEMVELNVYDSGDQLVSIEDPAYQLIKKIELPILSFMQPLKFSSEFWPFETI